MEDSHRNKEAIQRQHTQFSPGNFPEFISLPNVFYL